MYLKRLELHGFKSFAPRTVLEFSPGITAIVGPNGSGKSNVADGIRWVLGEQSMRQLRGKKSDDVIFAGGASRAAAQMAEVALVLDNSASWIPSEYTEVTVSRRSFRSGDSEYLSNGQRVRLKDVLLLLAQARVGHDSYTVIGQGMVDQALSQRADERRALFEDAAGIRQFQAQRTEAEQKLALTQSNLSRLRDILGEIEPRLGPLAEQARRAQEYSGTRDELNALLRRWYTRQWHHALDAREHAVAQERLHAQRVDEMRASIATRERESADLRQQHEALLAEIGGLRRERGETLGLLQTTERDLAVARERLASLDRQQSDLEGEQGQQEETIAIARAHVGALEAQIERAEAQADATAAELDALESAQHAARLEQEREEARLRAAQREVIQAQARLGAAQTDLSRLRRQLGERTQALASRREVVTLAQQKLERAEEQLAERREAFEQARADVEALVAQREQLNRDTIDAQAESDQLRAATADAQRERRALADRLALLEEWQQSAQGLDAGARTLLQSANTRGVAVLGVAAQLVSVPPELDAALEAALGVFLHAVVVRNTADARQAARWLRETGAGRAYIVWAEGVVPESGITPSPSSVPPADGDEVLGPLGEHITCSPELRGLFLRLLGDTLVVRDLDVTRAHWPDTPPCTVVTLAGEVLHPRGWMRGGRGSTDAAGDEASVLARQRELRELPARIDRQSHEIAALEAQYASALARLDELKQQAGELARDIQRAEALAQELARSLTAFQREQERALSEERLSAAVAEQLEGEVTSLEQEVAVTVEHVAEQERLQLDAAENVAAIQEDVDDMLSRSRSQQEELARARTGLAVQRQEVKALAQRADQLRAQSREVEQQLARRGDRIQAITSQRTELQAQTAEQDASLVELREHARALSEQLHTREASQAHVESQIATLEHGLGDERQTLARTEAEQQRWTLEAQRALEAIETLAEQIREDLGADEGTDPLGALAADEGDDEGAQDAEAPEPEPELTPEEMAKLRRQIDALRGRLRHLGGYDPDAPQAYQELKTRYDFLTGQINDMDTAAANLRTIIVELDATMRRQFEETFQAVNERFQRHFTTLFSGGAARLELTAPRREVAEDDDESDEPAVPRKVGLGGVEVYVQIPGKKVQDLSLLSGGERAMVSAALLFALLETNPPPFCLLDEVDAALDEANVVRFCEILKLLSEQTQFIVITHNRVTMTHADAIYGISMGGDSVSRVLSMRLAEVAAAR